MKTRLFPALDGEALFGLRRRCCSGRWDNPLRLHYPAEIPNVEGYRLTVVLQDLREVEEVVVKEGDCYTLSKIHISDVVGWKEVK